MKVRKLAVALALAGGLGSGVAQALGLGEIELQSYLNEPLDAEINLRKSGGVAAGDVFVNIAPQSAYERVGIDRSYFLTKLNFQVTTAPDGNLVVNVTSREPMREPYLNFLVEVTWPNGRLMREYAVLVDPPVYAEESGYEQQVTAPSVSQTSQTSQPRQQPRQAAPAQTTRPAAQSRSSGARTLGPTNSADTLWTIAAQVRPNNDVTMQQVMLALQDLNPDAFIDGNINRLMRGEVLRIPSEAQIRSRGRAEANQEVAVQNRAFSTPDETVDATGEVADGADGETAGGSGGDELRLVAAEDTSSRDTSEGGSAGGDGEVAGGADAGSAVAMEELESARRENEELTGRVDDLQDQVQTLQRLLELKNSQLADMQNTEAQPQAQAPEEGARASDQTAAAQDPEAGSLAAEGSPEPEGSAEQQPVASEEPGPDQTGEEGSADSEPEMVSEGAAGTDQSGIQQPQEGVSGAGQQESSEAAAPEPADTAPAQKPFPGNIIDMITNNFIYQVALGGGLVLLLLLLLLLARRNANREKAFYEQLNSETEAGESDSFDLTFDGEEDALAVPEGDAIEEADAYIAYGRNDQAAYTLETAISREPSRTDLRLKLLGVYASIQDRESFDKQFREIEALGDEDATAEANSVLARMEEDESMPSIDDLESQLRSGGFDQVESDQTESDQAESDQAESDQVESDHADNEPESTEPQSAEPWKTGPESSDDEFNFEDMDLDLPDADEEGPEEKSAEVSEGISEGVSEDIVEEESDDSSRDDVIEYDLSGIGSDESEASEPLESSESEELDEDEPFDFSLDEDDLAETDELDAVEERPAVEEEDELSLDFETAEPGIDEDAESPAGWDADADSDKTDQAAVSDRQQPIESDHADDEDLDLDGELDESFLDDLDAELDKVAGEEETAEAGSESELDDLELDVSDEDLALMEEFSEESDDDAPSEKPESAEDDELSLEDELGLEDALQGEEPADPEQEVEGAEQADEMLAEGKPDESVDEDDSDSDLVIPPVASDPTLDDDLDREIDESDLGDDDDFDFLSGTDEAATKLDLARAYVEMGDVDGARDILEEVALEGNDEQKTEAQDLLKNLS